MQEVLKDKLVTVPFEERETTLPSPDQLKYKIIIKNKKIIVSPLLFYLEQSSSVNLLVLHSLTCVTFFKSYDLNSGPAVSGEIHWSWEQ